MRELGSEKVWILFVRTHAAASRPAQPLGETQSEAAGRPESRAESRAERERERERACARDAGTSDPTKLLVAGLYTSSVYDSMLIKKPQSNSSF